MKKSLFFIINTLIISQLSFSQSTTILPNRLSVPNISANGTCDNTSKGSTVFNTTDNKMYFCNGTNWQEMTGGGFTLPYNATQAAGIALFKLKNPSSVCIYGESTTSTGVIGQSGSSYGVYGISDSNFGGFFASSTGSALGVLGKMNINNTSGYNGGILSINSSGNPSWQDPVAFSVNDLGVNNFSVVSNGDTKLPFTYKEFDLGNDFSTVNSDFTAPIKGVYHFDASVLWNTHTNGVGIVAITFVINNNPHFSVRLPAATGKEISNILSLDVLLNANDKVYVVAYQTSGVAQVINQNAVFSRFNGRLVYSQ